MKKMLTTHEVAEMAQVHRDTLLRWLREGRIPEPARDRNGWRVFTPAQAKIVVRYAQGNQQATPDAFLREVSTAYYVSPVAKLMQLDWDFADASTGYLTHSLHPYPAKFIPQIPNALIQELSSVGDSVLDPFCGSGTTLVEALLLKRQAIGVDANPLACLVARAKTTRLTENDRERLRQLETQVTAFAQQQLYSSLPLFPDLKFASTSISHPIFEGIDFWFDPHVIEELAMLKAMCLATGGQTAREIALTAFSSIIVAVSHQDSDTRYVRRKKNIQPGDTVQRFVRALGSAIARATEFTELTESRFTCEVIHTNILCGPAVGPVDLVVCSPPYPNAYSYHLYHRIRMFWLDMDQPTFKQVEIGSHRKYSKKGNGAATANTFRAELHEILTWLRSCLRPGGYACFVIGDSVLKGQVIHNDRILTEVATETGYRVEANLERRLQDGKKSFNPAIGKIKQEHIVILRNIGA
ncbi:MAG: MerR family DNA-binding transcriptional regulator [Nitrospinae bacterium]|nr:MerR family DNA-binding transcriptional regulator [Nitrospinota bacterium]